MCGLRGTYPQFTVKGRVTFPESEEMKATALKETVFLGFYKLLSPTLVPLDAFRGHSSWPAGSQPQRLQTLPASF